MDQHPIVRTLQQVRARLAAMPYGQREQVALAAGLTKNGLWRAADPSWEPKPTILARLDLALQKLPHGHTIDSTIRTAVRSGKPTKGENATGCVAATRESEAA